jgi:uncharacterized protein YdiU (UPF0061 family)
MHSDLAPVDLCSFDNTYARRLEGFYVACSPTAAPHPTLLRWNQPLVDELNLRTGALGLDRLARIFSGTENPVGAQPLAQAYAGHQYGNFVPQLGDGRAVLLGEVIDRGGRRRDLAFKGSGPTPFSRGGDGKAAVGPVLREFLLGEAMHALGIPTTRALAAVATGERVRRERPLPGAVLTRVAASHVRVGTFQFFAARGDDDKVRTLAEYVIERHEPQLRERSDRYLELLRCVAQRQAELLAQWMLVGFVHGVMNTDNMAVSGETIDFGPCAFMEAYDPETVFSSIDARGRYAYGRQPQIAAWNLARFAETLLPLIDASLDRAIAEATAVIESFAGWYRTAWLNGVRTKLGLATAADDDAVLADDWLALLQRHRVDFTLGWRRLADAADGNAGPLTTLFADAADLAPWLERWRRRLAQAGRSPQEVAQAMRRVNPLYIPRNQRVEEALAAASDQGDLTLFDRLLDAVRRPFEERPGLEDLATPAAESFAACYRTFCGT